MKKIFTTLTVTAALAIIFAICLSGCDKGYDEGYRAGLRDGADMFGAEQFDLDEWVEQHGGHDVSYIERNTDMGRNTFVRWRKEDYIVNIDLKDGRFEIYHVEPAFFIFGEKTEFVCGQNHPGLSKSMIYIPCEKGYAVSRDIIGVVEAADREVNQLTQAE